MAEPVSGKSESEGAQRIRSAIIALLDRALLILMIVELLYTVRVSFKAHARLLRGRPDGSTKAPQA